MSKSIPEEITVAKLSMEAARIALEALFAKIDALPRSEKVIATDGLQEACSQLRAAQAVVAILEAKARQAADEQV